MENPFNRVSYKTDEKKSGGFLAELLASIGIPLAVEAVKKLTGGSASTTDRRKPPSAIKEEQHHKSVRRGCPLHFLAILHT